MKKRVMGIVLLFCMLAGTIATFPAAAAVAVASPTIVLNSINVGKDYIGTYYGMGSTRVPNNQVILNITCSNIPSKSVLYCSLNKEGLGMGGGGPLAYSADSSYSSELPLVNGTVSYSYPASNHINDTHAIGMVPWVPDGTVTYEDGQSYKGSRICATGEWTLTLSLQSDSSVSPTKKYLTQKYTLNRTGRYNFMRVSSYKENVPVNSVYFVSTPFTLAIGEGRLLSARCIPSAATNKMLTWSSSNPSVVSVNSNGYVRGVSAGTATITARSVNGKYVSRSITVQKKNVINYDQFKYSFTNSRDSFGYGLFYRIPKERYMQLGFSEAVAKEIVKKRSFWSGSCFGMSASSILFYKNILQEERYKADVSTPSQFDKPNAGNGAFLSDKWEVKLRHMIEILQASQNLSGIDQPDFSPTAVAAEIDKGNPVKFGIREPGGSSHAVVIYGYTKNGSAYRFNIYDCSGFISSLTYTDSSSWSFEYLNTTYSWIPSNYCTYDTLLKIYKYITEKNYNDAISLFSLSPELSYTYIFRTAGDMRITNSAGRTAEIINGELNSEIDGMSLMLPSYMETENPQYTIIAPADTYTISGTGDAPAETSFADDNMSVGIASKASADITVSAELRSISVANSDVSDYSIRYTTYDNLFDEIQLTGTASETIKTSLDKSCINVTGADNIKVAASIGGNTIVKNVSDLSLYNDVNVEFKKEENEAPTIQLLSAGKDLTEKEQLPERVAADEPVFSLESGEYNEGQMLSFEKDEDTVIYYTTDGSEPSADNGSLYSSPIEINKSMTVKAVSTKYGYLNSPVTEREFILPVIAAPDASHISGEYKEVISVELFSGDEDDEIYYTLDGSDPVENGILYTSPITVTDFAQLKAYAVRNGCISEAREYSYSIASRYPFFFSNNTVNQDNEIITSENLNALTGVRLTVSKLTEGEQSGLFAAAFYDENDKLISISCKTASVVKAVDTIEIAINSDVGSARKIRLFAWKDLDSLSPSAKKYQEEISVMS